MTQIDLSRIPMPDVIEALDFETILSQMSAELVALQPDLADDLARESSMVSILLQVAAYRELLLRQRVNDGARAVMLASATGSDLDNLAALFGVQRLVITAADTQAIPPVSAEYESDTDLRMRVQLAPEAFTTGGTVDAYRFHALRADGDVRDVLVTSPAPGRVLFTVMSRTGDGTASAELLAKVEDAVQNENVRNLCSTLSVRSVVVQTYQIEAIIKFRPGPDRAVFLTQAQAAVEAHVAAQHAIGNDITRAGIVSAIYVAGVVQNVMLVSPASDLVIDDSATALCTSITLTDGGIHV